LKIAIAMSGGVDSTVTAILLKEEGHEIVGINANIFSDSQNRTNQIYNSESYQNSKKIAQKYNFPIYHVDIEETFSKTIIEPFCNSYLKGNTPNPCVLCNDEIKFKLLMKKAEQLNCDFLATGHYAKINFDKSRYYISPAKDSIKDQSYFLYRLNQELLSKTLFPLGDYTKDQIKEIARNHNLEVADKPESQEICFIPNDNYSEFIEQWTNTTLEPGDIIDKNEKKLGNHIGIHKYTIGQRRGLGIGGSSHPLYVTDIQSEKNKIIVGPKEDLEKLSIVANDIHYMKKTNLDKLDVLVKTRSTQKKTEATVLETDGKLIVNFKEKQYGISPGQSLVLYDNKGDLLGGGTIITSSKLHKSTS